MHSKSFGYTFTVSKEDIDFNGHVNNVTYLGWMIDAATEHSESVGFGYQECLALGGTWVAKSHHIEYRKPALEGDTLHMETWVKDIGRLLSTREYRIRSVEDESLVCEGSTEWVFVDSTKMRPMRIPKVIIQGFEY